MVDIADVSHATVNVKTFDKNPAKRTQEEVVQNDCNQCAKDLQKHIINISIALVQM